jgi:Hyaluronan / mRNA binding family
MTRTARAAFPRAVEKDRHESRTGLSASLRKDGGGAHNWGNALQDEQLLEDEAFADELADEETAKVEGEAKVPKAVAVETGRDTNDAVSAKDASEGDLETARKSRMGIMNKKSTLTSCPSLCNLILTKSFCRCRS